MQREILLAAVASCAIALTAGCSSVPSQANPGVSLAERPTPTSARNPSESEAHSGRVRHFSVSASSFTVISPNADPGSGNSPTFLKASEGALNLGVSQGGTLLIEWVCYVTLTDGTTEPCPSEYGTAWGPRTPSGFTGGFTPTSTTGGNPATEWFTVYPQTATGAYSAGECYTITDYSTIPPTVVGSGCNPLLIDVFPENPNPLPTPKPTLLLTTELHISEAGTPNGPPIPGVGHLYIEFYTNGLPRTAIQAGCKGNETQCATGINSQLIATKVTQYPSPQNGVDITSAVSQLALILRYNTYLSWQAINYVPPYNASTLNSNSWADGILLDAGVSQSQIGSWVSTLESKTQLTALAWKNGTQLVKCFDPGVLPPSVGAVPVAGTSTSNCTNGIQPGVRSRRVKR